MGLAYYPTFERDVNGVDPGSVDGKVLAAAMDDLNRISRERAVRPLQDFISVAANEIADLVAEEISEVPDVQWSSADDGLRTVRALVEALGERPWQVARSEHVITDLTNLEKVLTAAQQQNVRFRLAADF